MSDLRFMNRGKDPEDGVHQFSVRCTCPDRANVRAKVENGKVVWAGCPVCGKEAIVEVLPDGSMGCFPMGVVVF